MKRIIPFIIIAALLLTAFAFPVHAAEKVTVTFDLMYDGKTETITIDKGTAPGDRYFSRDGYDYYFFYADRGFSSRFDENAPLYEDTTVYVRWLEDDEIIYCDFYLYPESGYPSGTMIGAKGDPFGTPGEPGREGKVFAGWYLNKALTIPYDPTMPQNDDFEIYACFVDSADEVTCYCIFDSPDAETPYAGGFIKKGGHMFIPADPPMGEDDMLEGWYFNRALTNKVDFAQTVTYDYISLYPNIVSEEDIYWVQIYLDADAEYPTAGGMEIKGKPIPEPEPPGRDNYNFGGWYTDRALTQRADFTVPWYEDVSLFARWDAYHAHELTDVPLFRATATTDGCKAHMECSVCGRWFENTPVALIEIEDHESLVIPARGPYIMGDADGNGKVDIRDVTAVQRHIASLNPGLFCRAAANVISSDGLNITDATQIQRYLAEFIDEFA